MIARFISAVTVNNENRYEVALSWLEVHPALQDNRKIAERRLTSTLKKLKALNIYDEYDSIFNEWLTEGIIERVPVTEKTNWGYYLPHRPVIKEAGTTMIRLVFDASAKDQGNVSLNDCLQKGPNLLDLCEYYFVTFSTRCNWCRFRYT